MHGAYVVHTYLIATPLVDSSLVRSKEYGSLNGGLAPCFALSDGPF